MGERSRCGYRGCGHYVASPGECGRRFCPRNAERAASGAGYGPPVGDGPTRDAIAAWAAADPMSAGGDAWEAQRRAASLYDLPSSTPLSDVRFAVVDVETNDFDPESGSVVQVAVVECTGDGEVVDRWSTLVRPPDGRAGPTHVHGLSDDDLEGAPSFDEVLPELERRLSGRAFSAFNAWFDGRWIRAEMARAGAVPPDDVATVCTLTLARGSGVDRPSNRLGAICEEYGVSLENWHDALADAEAAAALLPHLLRECGLRTVGDLLGRSWDAHGSLRWSEPAVADA